MQKKSLKTNAILNIIRQLSTLLFPLITFPYISRVLQAQNYGKIAFSQSIINYFLLIAALGISNYAVRECAPIRDHKNKIQKLASELFSINVLSTIVSLILLGLSVLFIEKLQSVFLLLIILSTSIVFTTIGVEWINIIYEDYKYITIRTIAIQIFTIILMFMFVHEKSDYVIYVIITAISLIITNIVNFIYVRKYIKVNFTRHLNLKKHLKPLLILFFNNLMISVYVNSDITMLGFIRDNTEVGIYSVSVKIYTIIKSLMNAIVVVAIPRAAYYENTGDREGYNNLLNNILRSILIILPPVIMGVFMESKNILALISGQEYVEGYMALRFLSIAIGFSILATFITNLILLPKKKDGVILKATCSSAVMNLSLNFIFIGYWGYLGAAITTMLAEFLVVIICVKNIKGLVDLKLKRSDIISVCIGCLGVVVVCCLYSLLNLNNSIINEGILVAIASIIYFSILIILKNEIVIDYLNKIIAKIKS